MVGGGGEKRTPQLVKNGLKGVSISDYFSLTFKLKK